ncbi:MAG: superinfection immunity protein [Nanoarchaeota archaeon]|nr:superinfection immunity protein [Nanoarchaeota archaeon]
MDTDVLIFLLSLIIFSFLYFIPTFVAHFRHKENTNAIFLTNLFFGWTTVGWIIALIWAVTKDV